MAEDRAADSARTTEAEGWSTACRSSRGDGWDPVPAEDGVSVEGVAERLRLGLHVSPALQKWVTLGVFASIHRELLKYYDGKRGIDWKWSSLDSASVKAPKGGTSRAPTRRTGRKAA